MFEVIKIDLAKEHISLGTLDSHVAWHRVCHKLYSSSTSLFGITIEGVS